MTDGPDLVVAGAGGGLAGALRAAELGLTVLVVEASAHFRRGNNTSMSTAMFPGAGSRWQTEEGVDDSPEKFVADIMAKTHGQADPRLARTLADVSAPLVEWLADSAGLPLELVTDFNYPGHSVPRCHSIAGRHGSGVIDHLARRVTEHENIELLAPAKLVDVLSDVDGVRAAVVRYPDGTEEEIPTRAVLLATNGFGADADLVKRHLPEIAGSLYQGSDQSLGDALRIGEKLGAATGFLDAYQGHGAVSASAGTLVGWATIIHGGILVDLEGRRFGNEIRGYSEYAAELAARPGSTGWIVLDETIFEQCQPFQDFRDVVSAGALVWADDAPRLAKATGLPDSLTEELATAAAIARGEREDGHGRTNWERPLSGRYAAVRVVPALFHTQGGLLVDEHANVVDPQDRPIPGLYAAGGAAASISGHGAAGYLPGNGLLPAFGLAYLAAGDVARRRNP
ncbi:fumarate reductase flavoprotein subunit [Amycolatopsis sp. NBRC 101858]|uniref:FAD-dependent oxidoreductase n=1 Tax=Amycolatopsis sp. NBRC 101858 TaxID=3032200 RepID=UPI00249FC7F5|nr:FAD-binding protein [Amycolatopsis sp. NBRC 101858]GLY39965.1 fumarate reductase flavoprotein subunit [Amycolatopsis sp. NBRC 101858]